MQAKSDEPDDETSSLDSGSLKSEAHFKAHLTSLIDAKPPRVIGPVEELISVANTHYAKEDYTTAIKIYLRAMHIMENSGKFECHEDYISCSLNLGEAYLRMDDRDNANKRIQPVLLKVCDACAYPIYCFTVMNVALARH